MSRPPPAVKRSSNARVALPRDGQVVAIIVGLEDYQARPSGALPKVKYARNDAEEFAAALKIIYPEDRLTVVVLRDSEATCTSLDYELSMSINSLGADDLFIFYYAGHGFHGPGGNRITAWDTHPLNVEGTTLLLRDVLIDRLAGSPCERTLAFIDACASDFAGIVQARDVVTSMSSEELKEFLDSATYCAMFLSCKPGQKSYPSTDLRHGVWTHFLLKALKGEAEEAIGPDRYLTDVSLRDYLRQAVPRHLTRHMEVRGNQTPQAIITASNTFAICQVQARAVAIVPAGDMSRVRMTATRDYIEGVETGAIRSLDGFEKRRHHVPTNVNDYATGFVRRLLKARVDEEIQDLYESIKSEFGLRRKDISREADDGQGSLDTEFFRFSIDTRQHRQDPANYIIVRRLEFREDPEVHRAQIDEVFGRIFDKVVIEVEVDDVDFAALVDFFEDIEDAHGGDLKDEEHLRRLTYAAPDGTQVKIDIARGRISLAGGGHQTCSKLLMRAQQYRFGLSGKSLLLLS